MNCLERISQRKSRIWKNLSPGFSFCILYFCQSSQHGFLFAPWAFLPTFSFSSSFFVFFWSSQRGFLFLRFSLFAFFFFFLSSCFVICWSSQCGFLFSLFSVTRRSRSDSRYWLTYSLTHLLSVSTDLTDVTLVSDDTY